MSRPPRQERVKRERFMPFVFARGGLSLSLLEARLDDGEALALEPEALQRGEIHLEDSRFERLQLHLRLAWGADLLGRVLPEGERDEPPVRAVLVLREPRTRMRRSVDVPLTPLDARRPGVVTTVTVERDELAGPLTLTPALVRAAAGSAPAGFARGVGAHLASGRSLTVHPYAPRQRSGEFLDVQYRSFGQDPQLGTQPHRVHFLDLAGDHPVLFINSDHREVADALDARGQSGIRARLREVFYDSVALGVWSQLFMEAVEGLSEDGESRRPWQRGVLAELLPQMFPHLRRHGERVDELLAIRDSDHALSQLAALIDQALQRRLDLGRHMQKLVHEAVGSEEP
ncbi:MAG: hypothetical protein PVI30_19395 [Myxococcales bacterium]